MRNITIPQFSLIDISGSRLLKINRISIDIFSQLKHRKEIIVVELLLVIWSMREQALETRLIDDKITKHTLRNL